MMSRLSSSYLSLIVMVKQLSSLVKMDFNRFLNKSDYHILWSKSEIIFSPVGGAAFEVWKLSEVVPRLMEGHH